MHEKHMHLVLLAKGLTRDVEIHAVICDSCHALVPDTCQDAHAKWHAELRSDFELAAANKFRTRGPS